MKLLICQANPLVGDISGNTEQLLSIVRNNSAKDPDIIIFPELFLQGYPPRDLLERAWFIRQSTNAVYHIVERSKMFPETAILFGTVFPSDKKYGKNLVNAALLIQNGTILLKQEKRLLPSYDIFDETRYFEPAQEQNVVKLGGECLGITICEDAWNVPDLLPDNRYAHDPVADLVGAGATLLINLSASPFHAGKEQLRYNVLRNHASKHGVPFVFVNQAGGNDELIFDGSSMVVDGKGFMRCMLPAFREDVVLYDIANPPPSLPAPSFEKTGSVYEALVYGVREYMKKCGFSRALLGLSGGIDSALTAVIAARAVGGENVWGVTMPSRYSSDGSVGDSRILAEHLGLKFSTIPIEEPFCALLNTVAPVFKEVASDLTEENMQARIRGSILMALSNKFTMLLLSTGNKSEMSVGYATLYGDMNGGLCVISDLPKTMVYKLAHYINREEEVIPWDIINKAPSAELRPNQKDQDTLPPYDILDSILERLVESGNSLDEIVADGFEAATVSWVANAVARSEYKRRQAPIGLKVTPKAFGSGRRFPIAARYGWS